MRIKERSNKQTNKLILRQSQLSISLESILERVKSEINTLPQCQLTNLNNEGIRQVL